MGLRQGSRSGITWTAGGSKSYEKPMAGYLTLRTYLTPQISGILPKYLMQRTYDRAGNETHQLKDLHPIKMRAAGDEWLRGHYPRRSSAPGPEKEHPAADSLGVKVTTGAIMA